MPTYTYQCENCGVRFTRKQKFSEHPLILCPECGKKAVRRVYKPVGVVFKGSGFYTTDNRSSSATSRSSTNKTKSDESANSKPTEKKTTEKD